MIATCKRINVKEYVHDDQALTTVIESSTATTMMGLEKELKDAASSLERYLVSFSAFEF